MAGPKKKNDQETKAEAPAPRYMLGNHAAAEGALYAGVDFYAGYPITPSSEIMEFLAAELPRRGSVFVQMEDEIGSISAVIGASWAGAKAITATSGPGFSLMQEAIGYAWFTETPIVIIDVQRAGPCTGQATRVGGGDVMQARYGSHGDLCPVALSPWSVQELYDCTIKAVNLSERLRVPAFVLTEEAVGHLRESITLHRNIPIERRRKDPGKPPFGSDDPLVTPPMPAFGEGERLLVTGSTHDEMGFRRVDHPKVHEKLVGRLLAKVMGRRDEIVEVERHLLDDAEIAIVAYGFTARCALASVRRLRADGIKAGLLRLKTLWPFADREISDLGKTVKRIVVPEMNQGQVAGLVRQHTPCDVLARGQTNGEVISPRTLAAWVKEAS